MIRRGSTGAILLAAGVLIATKATSLSVQGQGRNEGLTTLQRDLTKELANKMKGTYVVAAVGDVLMQEPMGKMIDPAIQRILREAGIQIAGHGPNLSTARMPVFQHLEKGRVATVGAFPVPDRGAGSNGPSATNRNGNSGSEQWGMNPLRLTVWNVVTEPMLQQLKAMKEAIMAQRNEPDVARPMAVTPDP